MYLIIRVSTKWQYLLRKYIFANFCACRPINFRVFCPIFFCIIRANRKYLAERWFLRKTCYCKLTVSAQNQTTEGLSKKLHTNKARFCHHVYGFFGEFIKRFSFEKFLRISPEFQPKKFLRNSPDYFSGNSWEILRTWSPYLGILRGI